MLAHLHLILAATAVLFFGTGGVLAAPVSLDAKALPPLTIPVADAAFMAVPVYDEFGSFIAASTVPPYAMWDAEVAAPTTVSSGAATMASASASSASVSAPSSASASPASFFLVETSSDPVPTVTAASAAPTVSSVPAVSVRATPSAQSSATAVSVSSAPSISPMMASPVSTSGSSGSSPTATGAAPRTTTPVFESLNVPLAPGPELSRRDDFQGKATYYEVGLGACGGTNNDGEMVVAVNHEQYEGSCGRDISITDKATGKTVTAKAVDKCPGCAFGDLDMSPALFGALHNGDMGAGKFDISWHFN